MQLIKNSRIESETRGRPKVGRSACHVFFFSSYSSEFDKDIADLGHQFVHSQQPTLISARATSTTQRKRARFNELTILGTCTRPFHSSKFIFYCLQFMSHCHHRVLLFSSRYKTSPELTLFCIQAKDFCFESSRVHSRSRGTRTIPYTYRGCECVRMSEHQH
jgi:hypothetical protein